MLVKLLGLNGEAVHGGSGVWPLPTRNEDGSWTPGEWTAREPDPVPCWRGWHLVAPDQAFRWSQGARRVFIAEYDGAVACEYGKCAVETARLTEEITPDWPLLPLYPILRVALMDWWRCSNPEADWPEWATLRGALLRGVNLTCARLNGADLTGAYLASARLTGADLRGANLYGADLTGADLRGADLSGANLLGARLSGADLRLADLRGANLRYADLTDARLKDARLTSARLRRANLTGADLTDARLTDAVIDLPDGWEVDPDDIARRTDGAIAGDTGGGA